MRTAGKLGRKKKVVYFGDHDEFLKRLGAGLKEGGGSRRREEPCR